MRQKQIMAALVMAALAMLTLAPAACTPPQAEQSQPAKETQMHLKKLTPVLLAEDLEACVAFWKEFGLEMMMSVPHEDRLGFVILQGGAIELMYQSFDSARASNPAGIEGVNRSVVYLEVASLDAILPAAQKYEIVAPEHKTDYGAREIYIRDPGGNLIGFAEQSAGTN